MDAMGKDIILVETVGAGQAEVDIGRVADTTVLVLSPASGDEIQMIKAGITEIADLFVVNKVDQEGADNIAGALESMLGTKTTVSSQWKPGILLTEAIRQKGIEALAAEILRHREFLISSGELDNRRRERARLELTEAVESIIKDYLYQKIDTANLDRLVDEVARRKTSPHAAATKMVNQFGKQSKPSQG